MSAALLALLIRDSHQSDPYFAYVKSLMHFDSGANGAALVDVKGNTWAGTGGVSSTQSKFGGASLLGSSSNDSATISGVTFGTGDFTIEFWLNYLSITGGTVIFDCRDASHTNELALYLTGAGPAMTLFAAGANRITGNTPSTGQWYHYAVSRNSGTTRLFVNGVQTGGNYADSNNYANTKVTLFSQYNGVAFSNGYMDDMRITVGVGRYTSNFTPPGAPYPNQ